MLREYCPSCQMLQNMNMSCFESIENEKEDCKVKVTVKNYQCAICHSFVKSEETKEPAK